MGRARGDQDGGGGDDDDEKEPTRHTDGSDDDDDNDHPQEAPDETWRTQITSARQSQSEWAQQMREVQRPFRERREEKEQEEFRDLLRKGKIEVKMEDGKDGEKCTHE